MIRLYIKDAQGQPCEVNAEVGQSLMEVAHLASIPGIVAECGGACACATCHVYIESPWLERLPALDEIEDTMLDTVTDRKLNSRLSCQVSLSQEMDGMQVSVANNI